MTAVPATTTPALRGAGRGTSRARSAQGSAPWARARRALRRRRHLTAQRRHEMEPTTDAYIDRHGRPGLDPQSFAAFFGR